MEMDSLPNGNSAAAPPNPASAAAAPPPPASSKPNHVAESLKLEHQFLRVPFEHYKKTIRANHRAVEKEISAVVTAVTDRDDAVDHLTSLVSRLQGLKRKVFLSVSIASSSLFLISRSFSFYSCGIGFDSPNFENRLKDSSFSLPIGDFL